VRTVLLKSAGIWASFIPIAILNGLIREKLDLRLLLLAMSPFPAARVRGPVP